MKNPENRIRYISITPGEDGVEDLIQDLAPPELEPRLIRGKNTGFNTDTVVRQTTYDIAPDVPQYTNGHRQHASRELFAVALAATAAAQRDSQPEPDNTPTPPKSNARRATHSGTIGTPVEIITVPSHQATTGEDIVAAFPPPQPSSTTPQRPVRRAVSPEGPPSNGKDTRADSVHDEAVAMNSKFDEERLARAEAERIAQANREQEERKTREGLKVEIEATLRAEFEAQLEAQRAAQEAEIEALRAEFAEKLEKELEAQRTALEATQPKGKDSTDNTLTLPLPSIQPSLGIRSWRAFTSVMTGDTRDGLLKSFFTRKGFKNLMNDPRQVPSVPVSNAAGNARGVWRN